MSAYWIIGINFVTSLVLVLMVNKRINTLRDDTAKVINDLTEIILKGK